MNPKARAVRRYRTWHKRVGLVLFIFFLVMAVTGLLLGMKKQTGLLAPTQKGMSADAGTWLPMDSLQNLAVRYLGDSVDRSLSTEIDRIDIRPGKGIAKFQFTDHFWGLQLDCTTGKLLLVERRSADFIEALHDGSIVDRLFGTSDEQAKVAYSTLMGASLLLMALTGFWLWYGPKRIRKERRAG
jgi:uncharacterized iron-regulated membrane protein